MVRPGTDNRNPPPVSSRSADPTYFCLQITREFITTFDHHLKIALLLDRSADDKPKLCIEADARV